MSAPHINHYIKKKVAEVNSKGCELCYRPTDTVLVSKDSKDWFYVCPTHLNDAGFAVPMRDLVAEEAEKERLKQIEIEKVKAEYEKKKAIKAAKKTKEDEKEKEENKKGFGWFGLKGLSDTKTTPQINDEDKPAPDVKKPASDAREFSLHRNVHQHRINLKMAKAQEAATAKQWAKLEFPSVPSSR